MERTNIKDGESNSDIGRIVGRSIGPHEFEGEGELERERGRGERELVHAEAMIHRGVMSNHVTAMSSVHDDWQTRDGNEFDLLFAGSPLLPAAAPEAAAAPAATAVSSPAYYPRADDIGMDMMSNANVDGGVLVHPYSPGMEGTSRSGLGPAPSQHVNHDLPNSSMCTPCTSRGVKIHANDV